MKYAVTILKVIGASILLGGCTGGSANGGENVQPQAEVYFLQQKPATNPEEQVTPAALLEGKLILANGCLRLQGKSNERGLATIWPSEFDFDRVGGKISIVNSESKIVAQVGNRIQVSGGEIKDWHPEMFRQNVAMSVRCLGPYAIMGSDVVVIEP